MINTKVDKIDAGGNILFDLVYLVKIVIVSLRSGQIVDLYFRLVLSTLSHQHSEIALFRTQSGCLNACIAF